MITLVKKPVRRHPLSDPRGAPLLEWERGLNVIQEALYHWLTTSRWSGGEPHTRPVLAVVCEDAIYTTSNPDTVKSKNLRYNSRCSLASRDRDLDLVVEARAQRVMVHSELEAVAKTYLTRYDWPVEVRAGAFEAEYGAPTAGPPPYNVYRLEPITAYAFGTNDKFAPRSTRWEFGSA